MKTDRYFLLFSILIIGLAVLPPEVLAQKMEKVTYRHTYFLNGTYAPHYLAIDKGYFAQEGIEAEITEGKGSGLNAKLIGAGSIDFASCDFGVVSKAVSEGVPIQAIFGEFLSTAMAVIFLEETGIKNPNDLKGKTIACFPGSGALNIFPALLKANKIDEKDVKIVLADAGALYALLMDKKVDAILDMYHDDVPTLESRGVKVGYLKYSDWGLNLMGNGTITFRKMIQERPELVRRFLRALAKGMAYSQTHPDEAIDSLMKRGPRASREVLLKTLLNYFPLTQTKYTKGKPMGWMAKEDWESTQELMFQYGGQKKKVSLEELYTNDFIP